MMKKTYKSPEMEVVVMKNHEALLAGSPQLNGTYEGGTILAPALTDDFDEE